MKKAFEKNRKEEKDENDYQKSSQGIGEIIRNNRYE